MNLEPLLKSLQQIIPIHAKDFDVFSKSLKSIQLKKNEIWEHEGRVSEFMGFVNKGILREYHLKEGIEYTSDFHMEHEYVGNYVSYQTGTPSLNRTEAIEACELLIIPFREFESFYASIPATQEAAKVVGEQKLLHMYKQKSSLLMNTPEERYYALLEQKPELINRVPQYLIAQYLGIRPESLSRIRKRHSS